MAARDVHVLLVSGSTRALSTNGAALRAASQLELPGVTTQLFDGLVALPAFNPDRVEADVPPEVVELRQALAGADAVLVCTPEYAGTLPGSLKNLLDWTVGGADLVGKPCAWFSVANSGRGEGASATLRSVLGYVDADIVEQACLAAPVSSADLTPDGLLPPGSPVVAALSRSLAALAEHVRAAAQA